MGTVRAKKDIESALSEKGFQREHGRDHIFYFFARGGRRTRVYTKVSHSGKDVGPKLISRMARQCKLTKAQFLGLVDCSLTGEGYLKVLMDGGHLTSGKE